MPVSAAAELTKARFQAARENIAQCASLMDYTIVGRRRRDYSNCIRSNYTRRRSAIKIPSVATGRDKSRARCGEYPSAATAREMENDRSDLFTEGGRTRNRCSEINVFRIIAGSLPYIQMSGVTARPYQSKKFHRHANMVAARFPHRTTHTPSHVSSSPWKLFHTDRDRKSLSFFICFHTYDPSFTIVRTLGGLALASLAVS